MKNELNVLFQSSDLYAPITGVAILSLFENNKHVDNLNVYLFDDGISNENKIKLTSIAKDYNRSVKLICIDEITQWLESVNIPKWCHSYTTYCKLFISRLLPDDIDRVLYIDSDTLILGSLQDLMHLDLTAAPLAMTLDSIYLKYKQLIGLNSNDRYYNAGVILFNLKYWRDHNFEIQIMDYLKNIKNVFFAVDMDVLNVLFTKIIVGLPLRYNVCSGVFLLTSTQIHKIYLTNEQLFYSDTEIIEARSNPTICHFTGGGISRRPWEKKCFHPLKALWHKYLNLSPWQGLQPFSGKFPLYLRFQKACYLVLPPKMYSLFHRLSIDFFFKLKLRQVKKIRNNG